MFYFINKLSTGQITNEHHWKHLIDYVWETLRIVSWCWPRSPWEECRAWSPAPTPPHQCWLSEEISRVLIQDQPGEAEPWSCSHSAPSDAVHHQHRSRGNRKVNAWCLQINARVFTRYPVTSSSWGGVQETRRPSEPTLRRMERFSGGSRVRLTFFLSAVLELEHSWWWSRFTWKICCWVSWCLQVFYNILDWRRSEKGHYCVRKRFENYMRVLLHCNHQHIFLHIFMQNTDKWHL